MVDQATRIDYDSRVGPIRGVTQGASSVIGDAMDLAELQTELLKADTSSCLQRVKSPIIGLIVALCLLLSALPVFASGLAQLLSTSLEWPLWLCQLLVGGLFLVAGGGIAWWGVQRLRHALAAFSPSQREAAANIKWLRQTIGRTFSHR